MRNFFRLYTQLRLRNNSVSQLRWSGSPGAYRVRIITCQNFTPVSVGEICHASCCPGTRRTKFCGEA